MRYFKIIGFFCLLFTTTLRAQKAQKDYTSLSFGVGQFFNSPVSGNVNYTIFSRREISQTSRFGPQFSLGIEGFFAKKWSLGLQFLYASAQSDRETRITGSIFGNSRVIEKVSSRAGGGEFNIKYFFYEKEELSIYVTGSLGGLVALETGTTAGGALRNYADYWLSLNGGIGARYFPSEQFGAFAELNYKRLGPPHGIHFNCGLILKI